jgi:carbon monoxide dehydrogenase subunit G
MDLSGEYRINAPRQAVWEGLNNPTILKQAIAGCEELVKTSDSEFQAQVVAKVGPVKAKFGGKVTLSDLDPPNGYTITGEGQGGAAGFAKGGAKVRLEAAPEGGTLLKYTVDAQIGGKLAQIGSRLIEGTARKMSEEFFAAFAAAVEAQTPSAAATEPDAGAAPAMTSQPATTIAAAADSRTPAGLSPLVWIGGLIAVIAAILYWFVVA